MTKTTYIILTLLVSACAWAGNKEPKLTPQEKYAMAIEGEALRRQAVRITSYNAYYILDTALLQRSIDLLVPYVYHNKQAETKFSLALAENYYNLGQHFQAGAYYQSRMGDGLSQLRLGALLYQRPNLSRNDMHKVINYLVHGLSMPSVDTLDYRQASKWAKETLPMCYHQLDDDENARRYHRAYTDDSEGEAFIWLYRVYWADNDSAQALRCATIAVRTEPNNPLTNEAIAGHYFNLQQYDLALPYWQKAAQLGSGLGHVRLAQSYHYAMGCEQNDSLAIAHFEAGLPTVSWVWAERLLADLYLMGDSTTNPYFNVDRALYWLSRASEQGDWQSKSKLASNLAYWARQPQYAEQKSRMLHQANGLAIELTMHNRKDSVGWHVLAEYIGDSLLSQPIPNIRELKSKRRYIAISAERDMRVCQILAEAGDLPATIQLAQAYATGVYAYSNYIEHRQESVDTCASLSFQYWQRGIAIDPTNMECIMGITNAYTYGIGTSVNILAAKQFWESHGMFNYAGTYFYPWRTFKIQHGDYDEIIYMFSYYDISKLQMPASEAIYWLNEAATKGDKDQRNMANYLLGTIYEAGELVEKDCAKAINYYKQSASLDNGNANHRLGEIYKNGECDTPRNATIAARYYFRSYKLTNNQDDYWEYMSLNEQQ